MNLHEYQGKEIFAKYDLPVSKGKVVTSLDEVEQARGAASKLYSR